MIQTGNDDSFRKVIETEYIIDQENPILVEQLGNTFQVSTFNK